MGTKVIIKGVRRGKVASDLFGGYIVREYEGVEVGRIIDVMGGLVDRDIEAGEAGVDIFPYTCRALLECGHSCDGWVRYYFDNLK